MGRYYSGDIEGKFWFAIQSSDAADRFGVTGTEPQYLNYYFDKEDLPEVQKELKDIETKMGKYLKMINDFFEKRITYTHEELHNYLNVSKKTSDNYLREYADYLLGKKIEECIIKQGSCDFDAEC